MGVITCGVIQSKKKQWDISHSLRSIGDRFYLTDEHIVKMQNFFHKIDKHNTGYIYLEDVYDLIGESQSCSIVAPFLDRLFFISKKFYPDKISFEELLPNLVSFCLFSVYQIIEFVFFMLDRNSDDYISREDIIKLLSTQRKGENLYNINHSKRVEQYTEIVRSDKISLKEFVLICKELPFIYFPAIRLQSLLRSNYIRESFWVRLNKNTRQRYLNVLFKLDGERIQNNINQIKEKVADEKKQNFINRWKAEEEEKKRRIYKEEIRLNRKRSDTLFYLDKFNQEKEIRTKRFKKKFPRHLALSVGDVPIYTHIPRC